MKPTFTVFAFATLFQCLGQASAQDNPTARQALSVIDPQLATRVIEATGQGGTTQPRLWRFVTGDPAARGGVRVIEVSDGRIARQQTPSRAYVGGGNLPAVDMLALRIDSSDAFRAANEEAVRAGIGFDSADYALRIDVNTGRPAWVVTLVSRDNRPLGNVFVSPETGRVTRVENLYGRRPAPSQQVQVEVEVEESQEVRIKKKEGFERSKGFFRHAEDHIDKGGFFIEKGARTVGATLQEFFTGRRTIDRKYWEKERID